MIAVVCGIMVVKVHGGFTGQTNELCNKRISDEREQISSGQQRPKLCGFHDKLNSKYTAKQFSDPFCNLCLVQKPGYPPPPSILI